jgi:hypothetical protein
MSEKSQGKACSECERLNEALSVLRTIYELLEEHEPPWYLRRHYNLMVKVLGKE